MAISLARKVRRGHKGSKASRESKDQKEIKEKKAILGRKVLLEPPEPQALKAPKGTPARLVQPVLRDLPGILAPPVPRAQKGTLERPDQPDRREPPVQPDLPGPRDHRVQKATLGHRVLRGFRGPRGRKGKKENRVRAASQSRYRDFFHWVLNPTAAYMPTIQRDQILRNLSTTAILESFII